MKEYINITLDNIDNEHLCCAISDKKHIDGVNNKKKWLKERITEGHVFRKLNAQGKIFIEYAPLDKAWVPIVGDNYYYIYCLWVAGNFKGKGYAKELLEYAINDAKENHMNGICVISSKKKKPFISEKGFFTKYNFKVVDTINDYELLALSFNDSVPQFNSSVKENTISELGVSIFYSDQCPYVNNCIKEISDVALEKNLKVNFHKIDSLQKAKDLPCIFNNWAVFKDGEFLNNTLLNANSFLKLFDK